MRLALAFGVLLLALFALPGGASASAGASAAEVVRMFDASLDPAGGWNGFVVRLRAPAEHALQGEVSITCSGYARGDKEQSSVSAPFNVPAGTAAVLRVPVFVREFEQIDLVVKDASGDELASAGFTARGASEIAMLLDVSPASRFAVGVNDRIVGKISPHAGGGGANVRARVARPAFDYGSGDPILPDRAALYGPVSVVLMKSDVLSRLHGTDLDALVGWVLSGGTLAIVVTRPEDLRNDTLVALAGGVIAPAPAAELARQPAVVIEDGSKRPPKPTGPGDPQGTAAPAPAGPIAASAELLATMRGYAGGNLAASHFGATATYGLGEVHLLAFDTTQASASSDPFLHARLGELLTRAWELRGGAVTSQLGHEREKDVLRTLDPNDSSLGGVLLAALLLVAYGVLVGPVNFIVARNKGRPILAFVRLPIFAFVAFVAILMVGLVTKGVRGRALHLTLIEAGAGVERGSARRYRGFYLARASDLTVRASPGSLAATIRSGFGRGKSERLVVDRDGARLADVSARPWQVVAIREEGTAEIGRGVSILPDPSGFRVVNHAGKRLRGVIVRVPDPTAHVPVGRYFDAIDDGASVIATDGVDLSAEPGASAWLSATTSLVTAKSGRRGHTMQRAQLDWLDKKRKGLADAWRALDEDTAGADWFPGSAPVLLAEIEGGEGAATDAGLRVDRERVLVRIVGWGGDK